MAFFECEFPTGISFRARGGPGFSTQVNQGFSGGEQRNRNWALSRGKWNISLKSRVDVNRQQFIDQLLAFFLAVGGRGDAFRLKDHKDFQFSGQSIGVGDGTTTQFQLTRTYVVGGRSYVRTITKPITSAVVNYLGANLPDTVKLYDNGAVIAPANFSVDATTGLATITVPPVAGHRITADGQFHYPVRFDSDDFPMQVEESFVSGGQILASLNSIGLIEVRPPQY